MNFTPQQIAAECQILGAQVAPLPSGIDGSQLLWSLSGNESSFGVNCTPRHEPAFDVGGTYAQSTEMKQLLALYGHEAACSYGPLQIMLVNASGAAPADFDNLRQAMVFSIGFLNSLLRRFTPRNLVEIGSCWNHGRIQNPMSPGVSAYCRELAENYAKPMVSVPASE